METGIGATARPAVPGSACAGFHGHTGSGDTAAVDFIFEPEKGDDTRVPRHDRRCAEQALIREPKPVTVHDLVLASMLMCAEDAIARSAIVHTT